ncbi:hypothetical protein F4824DRAFT_475169 [Ustulina deusta]|nr:hypothetical protein F4824DRAFT_475169 [Ustulina deusta]
MGRARLIAVATGVFCIPWVHSMRVCLHHDIGTRGLQCSIRSHSSLPYTGPLMPLAACYLRLRESIWAWDSGEHTLAACYRMKQFCDRVWARFSGR